MYHYVEHIHMLYENMNAKKNGQTILIFGETINYVTIKPRKLIGYFNKNKINYFKRYSNTLVIKDYENSFVFIEKLMQDFFN